MKVTASGSISKEMRSHVEKVIDPKKQLFMHLMSELFHSASFEEVEDIEHCAVKITATISVLSEKERETLLRLVGEMAHSTDVLEKIHKCEEITMILKTI